MLCKKYSQSRNYPKTSPSIGGWLIMLGFNLLTRKQSLGNSQKLGKNLNLSPYLGQPPVFIAPRGEGVFAFIL